jgi:hypothetical protein
MMIKSFIPFAPFYPKVNQKIYRKFIKFSSEFNTKADFFMPFTIKDMFDAKIALLLR